MLYYVAHEFGGKKENVNRAKKITHDLQASDLENCYICPLMIFSHLEYGELGRINEMELCFDVLQNCDSIIIASEISSGVREEIELAERLGLEVLRLDESGELQPFSE